MYEKIIKLIKDAEKEETIQPKLISLAKKLKDKSSSNKNYLLIDIKEMLSQVDPDAVDIKHEIERIEV